MRDLRGRGHAFPFPADGAATLSAEQRHSMNGTGFRLVHDEVGRVNRGGSWYFTADLAGRRTATGTFLLSNHPCWAFALSRTGR